MLKEETVLIPVSGVNGSEMLVGNIVNRFFNAGVLLRMTSSTWRSGDS